jgi:hypothetical protein
MAASVARLGHFLSPVNPMRWAGEVGGQYAGQSSELDTGPSVVQDWGSPTICTKPGLKAVDLFEARTVKSRRFG